MRAYFNKKRSEPVSSHQREESLDQAFVGLQAQMKFLAELTEIYTATHDPVIFRQLQTLKRAVATAVANLQRKGVDLPSLIAKQGGKIYEASLLQARKTIDENEKSGGVQQLTSDLFNEQQYVRQRAGNAPGDITPFEVRRQNSSLRHIRDPLELDYAYSKLQDSQNVNNTDRAHLQQIIREQNAGDNKKAFAESLQHLLRHHPKKMITLERMNAAVRNVVPAGVVPQNFNGRMNAYLQHQQQHIAFLRNSRAQHVSRRLDDERYADIDRDSLERDSDETPGDSSANMSRIDETPGADEPSILMRGVMREGNRSRLGPIFAALKQNRVEKQQERASLHQPSMMISAQPRGAETPQQVQERIARYGLADDRAHNAMVYAHTRNNPANVETLQEFEARMGRHGQELQQRRFQVPEDLKRDLSRERKTIKHFDSHQNVPVRQIDLSEAVQRPVVQQEEEKKEVELPISIEEVLRRFVPDSKYPIGQERRDQLSFFRDYFERLPMRSFEEHFDQSQIQRRAVINRVYNTLQKGSKAPALTTRNDFTVLRAKVLSDIDKELAKP